MRADTIRFLFTAALWTLAIFGAAFLLSSCGSAKYYECLARDATSRPCN